MVSSLPPPSPRAHAITHAATLEVSANLLRMVTFVITRARRGPRCLPRTRAASARAKALLVIRYPRDAPPIWRLARDTGVSSSTAQRDVLLGAQGRP